MSNELLLEEIAPTGVLRAAINLSNNLLVTGTTDSGEPDGVSPDMARAIAKELGVPCQLITYDGPGPLADAATKDVWDIGNIANEPARAKVIAFSPAYTEIQANYLLPENSPLETLEQVDQPGIRIVTKARAAYDLWLTDHIQHAELVRAEPGQDAFTLFAEGGYDALASLKPLLMQKQSQIPGSKILEQPFTAIKQSIGCQQGKPLALAFITEFVNRSIENGFVQSLIEKHGVVGRLSVANP